MTRTMLLALAATTAVAGTAYLYGQGTPVQLQPTTPGTQQVGNANVSGRVIAGFVQAGSIQAENGSPNAQVIVGNATSTSGANFGGFFRSDSPLGRALYGRASATSGTTHGVWGQADSPGGRGVTGVAPATTGNATGVWGQTASTTGRGVYGYTTSASGVNYGVMGQSSSPAGFGVYSVGKMHATGIISGNGSGLANVNADLLDGLNSTAFLQSIPNPLTLSGTSDTHIISGVNHSWMGTSSGVYGGATNPSSLVSGVLGEGFTGVKGRSSSSSGRGMVGVATASTGSSYGGLFQNASSSGTGVFGWATASGGETYGVYGQSESSSGQGVRGIVGSVSGANYGGFFQSRSPSGEGVRGINVSTSGAAVGGYFISASTDARALYGLATSASGTTYGVVGQSNSNVGYGVWGTSGGSGYAVFASGHLGASGVKSFRIDHPLDPENKYLLHYSSESPMPQNFYVGNVVTDAQGFAWVTLPDYFTEINENFKYQLTVISSGADFVQVMVSQKIRENRFQVRTSAPNTEVSWRVDADRNDLYVRNRPPKDVVAKQGHERGTYQHPEFYGFGPERGMTYAGERQETQNRPAKENR
ncbi:MAG: hypothetical protein IT363_09550 [Methanoregulaceae archaeon]|nr:hypothetical protein [Methanoregulaceae archaeon]